MVAETVGVMVSFHEERLKVDLRVGSPLVCLFWDGLPTATSFIEIDYGDIPPSE